MKIRIFVTGGTFDKEYAELQGKLSFKKTHVQEMLKLGRNRKEVAIKTLMMIDSLSMTPSHRQSILKSVQNAKEGMIVITHGTDTMVETARLLGRAVHGKTVVFTGAMVPYKFGSSDGMYNLGSAIAFVQALPPGVYVAMNGKCFHYYNVRKNKKKGEFETIK